MDETRITRYRDPMPVRSGFPGERISVLPRPRVIEAGVHPVTSRLIVTDSGYFPKAADHSRSRPSGAPQAIIIVCIDGLGWCELAGLRHVVRPGQAIVLPARVPHVYGASSDDPWTVYWMHVDGSDVADIIATSGSTREHPVVDVPDVTRVVALLDEIVALMERDDAAQTLLLSAGVAWQLLAHLSTSRYGRTSVRSDPVQVAIRQLQKRFTEQISVSELAGSVCLSTSHFAALFRRATGCGPHEYQTRLRMMRSRQLLDTTDLPVSVIARHVGYEDPLHFARKFRAVHGVTASQHRERTKG